MRYNIIIHSPSIYRQGPLERFFGRKMIDEGIKTIETTQHRPITKQTLAWGCCIDTTGI